MNDKMKNPKYLRWGILALATLLVIIIAAFILTTKSINDKAEEAALANEQLQLTNEQLQLANEYQALNVEFQQYENQSQLLANDSLVTKYAAAKSKVEKLLQELNSEKKKKRTAHKETAGRNRYA